MAQNGPETTIERMIEIGGALRDGSFQKQHELYLLRNFVELTVDVLNLRFNESTQNQAPTSEKEQRKLYAEGFADQLLEFKNSLQAVAETKTEENKLNLLLSFLRLGKALSCISLIYVAKEDNNLALEEDEPLAKRMQH